MNERKAIDYTTQALTSAVTEVSGGEYIQREKEKKKEDKKSNKDYNLKDSDIFKQKK